MTAQQTMETRPGVYKDSYGEWCFGSSACGVLVSFLRPGSRSWQRFVELFNIEPSAVTPQWTP